MPISCEGCGHCCHDMKRIFGFAKDLNEFVSVGNKVIYHSDLSELNNMDLEDGLHVVFINNNEVRMTLVGNCSALDVATRLCSVHDTDLLPAICKLLMISSAGCRAARLANGLDA